LTTDNDIKGILIQEEALQFTKFGEAEAWALGSAMRDLAIGKNLSLVIDIRIGTRPVFYTALPGTSGDNPEWARRKMNTVLRFLASSYRVGLEGKASGKPFDATRGLDPMNYANAGGGFPIRVNGTVIGAIIVSGAPQRQDHEFVVEAICQHLDVPYSKLALGAESA
jgi:uncharacterized protein (UPF0303 family)